MTIPGWEVTDDDGLLVAVRHGDLSEYQTRYGAMAEVTARDDGELWLLCEAQTRLAERLGTAENVAVKVRHLRAAAEPLAERGWAKLG